MKLQFIVDSKGEILSIAPVYALSNVTAASNDAPESAGVLSVSGNGSQSVHVFDVDDDVLLLTPEKFYSRFRVDLTSKEAKLIEK